MLHEVSTSQTLVINERLACHQGVSAPPPTFIELGTFKAVNLDEEAASVIASIVNKVQAEAVLAAERKSSNLIIDISKLADSSSSPSEESKDTFARRVLVSLCGVLLEYPFIYYIPPRLSDNAVQNAFKGRPLCFMELVLNTESVGKTFPLIKFSIPQSYKNERTDEVFSTSTMCLGRYEERLQASKVKSISTGTFNWQISDNVTSTSVAL